MQQLKNEDACCLKGEKGDGAIERIFGRIPGMNGRIGM